METSEGQKERIPEEQLAEATEIVKRLPQELQRVITCFFVDTAKTVLAQQTSVSDGDNVRVSVTPEQLKFYEDRFAELDRSGALNPRNEAAGKKLFTE